MIHLSNDDPELARLVSKEEKRLENTLDLIAAENHSPESILEVMGSVFNTKTIEGYPGKRFHAGCIHVDEVETLAIERGKALFEAEYNNVQPHSGTSVHVPAPGKKLKDTFITLNISDKILIMAYGISCQAIIDMHIYNPAT
ncbi:MAG: hypothetical protein U9P36_12615 [Thermodesulfobacteriota bacterium]|nr:hypothetical protein [Thermodesulfobacteriota bacterium]